MGKKLYVGNLPYSVRDGDLEQAFGQFGTVTSAKVMMERDTGRSKGFGFVEMGSDDEAQSAITGMNGQPLCPNCGDNNATAAQRLTIHAVDRGLGFIV